MKNANRDHGCQLCFKEPKVGAVAGFRIGERCLKNPRAIAKAAGREVPLEAPAKRRKSA